MAFERLARRRHRAPPIVADARPRLHLAGADRAPDRGAAQEHPRRRARDRRAASAARHAARRARELRRQRGADPRPRHPALADAHAAHRQADGRRRDRERAQLLPRDLPAQIPRLYREIEEALPGPRDRAASSAWATGSAATATATRSSAPTRCARRFARQSETVLRYYLTEVHELGAELSISATLAAGDAGDAARSPTRRPTRNAHREDEPYRRALIGVYARLAATLHELHRHRGAAPRGRAAATRTRRPSEFLADLRIDRGVAGRAPRRGADRGRAWRR